MAPPPPANNDHSGSAAAIVNELKTLRKGRGLLVREIGDRVGPALRDVFDVSNTAGPAEVRRAISEHLERLATSLPEDLQIAIMAAFALHPDARLPFYQERVRWTAQRLYRDDRTARRRIDEAIERLAELAMSARATAETAEAENTAGWHTEELRITLVLDLRTPESFEFRRVVADRDSLAELDLAMTVTAPPDRRDKVEPDELSVDVFYGGNLVTKAMESTDRVGFVLQLPRPLAREDRHDFALRYRVLNSRVPPIQPHYVCVPKHRCDVFDLHVRFAMDRLPARIWRLVDAFQRDIDDPAPSGEMLFLDSVGEVHTTFRRLTPGLAYGIRWTPWDVPDPPSGVMTH